MGIRGVSAKALKIPTRMVVGSFLNQIPGLFFGPKRFFANEKWGDITSDQSLVVVSPYSSVGEAYAEYSMESEPKQSVQSRRTRRMQRRASSAWL
jgi:hypothetical protein